MVMFSSYGRIGQQPIILVVSKYIRTTVSQKRVQFQTKNGQSQGRLRNNSSRTVVEALAKASMRRIKGLRGGYAQEVLNTRK
eukprot:3956205-Pleurochrysis_carterae.AAC.5